MLILITAALTAVAACVPDYRPIPVGTYFNSAGEEEVVVGESDLQFYIRTYDAYGRLMSGGPYTYTVDRNGRIVADIRTTGEWTHVYQCSDWYWNGDAIIRVNCRDGMKVSFMRHPAPQ